jgi:hypothetical protein
MALQRITPSMSLDECAACYQEWLELHNELVDYVTQHPERVREARATFVRAYTAAHQGVMLTDRAALAIVDKEDRDAEPCPYPPDSDAASVWQALCYAQEIRHHRAIRQLTYQLERMTYESSTSTATAHSPTTPRQRINRPRRREPDDWPDWPE